MMDAAREAGAEVDEPLLPAVLRSQRRLRPRDDRGIRHQAGRGIAPGASGRAAGVARRDAYPWRAPQALHLARLAGREDVERAVDRREPYGCRDFGATGAIG